jgi:hypothetical protein
LQFLVHDRLTEVLQRQIDWEDSTMIRFHRRILAMSVLLAATSSADAQNAQRTFRLTIPKTWVDDEMASLEIPLANPAGSPKHISADYYYRIPVLPIYKPYTWYAPGQEPPGYLESLKQHEPEIIWGEDKNGQKYEPPLNTEEDWIRAGQIVFEAPIGFTPLPEEKISRMLYERIKPPLSRGDVIPFMPLVVREKGKVEVGGGSCAHCHTRVMPDGTIIQGAQGNYPLDWEYAALVPMRGTDFVRNSERLLYVAPRIAQDPNARLQQMSVEEIISVHQAIPPGVIARHRSSA